MDPWRRLEEEEFEAVHLVVDRAAGLRAVLAVHDAAPGAAFGGIRRAPYADSEGVLDDALRLARAMSRKCVLAGLPVGGAKMVLWDRPELDRDRAYRVVGDVLERLGGRWFAGPDVGTGWPELDRVAERTRYVTRRPPRGPGRLGEATAAGVFAGLVAGLEQLGDRPGAAEPEGRHVVLQGLGAVGAELARRLLRAGARVSAAEPVRERSAPFLDERGFTPLAPGEELEAECDVFAPCALGGLLDARTIPRLRTRVVCGAANNPCRSAEDGERLFQRGILYVPDVLVTAGAVMRGVEHELAGRVLPLEEIEERVGRRARGVLRSAFEQGLAPEPVALAEADRLLAERRSSAGACERAPTFVSGRASVSGKAP